MNEPTVILERGEPESIMYKRGMVYTELFGFHASLYLQMIWQYGKSEATEKFWWLWHEKKEA